MDRLIATAKDGHRAVSSSMVSRSACVGFVLFAALGAAAPVQAQLQNLRFNFLAPGARSLALGGAFLALADDATAAYTNPAGLSSLSLGGPEVAFEFRGWRYRNTDLAHLEGNFSGRPTGIGIDTQARVRQTTSESDTQGLSFLSFGYVLPHGWTVAAYRHELANFQLDILSQGLFWLPAEVVPLLPPGSCNPSITVQGQTFPCRFGPIRSRASAEIVNTGFSAAYQLSDPVFERLHDSLSIGIGLVQSEAEIEVLNDLYAYSAYAGSSEVDRRPGGLFGPADLTADRLLQTGAFRSAVSDVVYTGGFLWKLGKGQHWSVGGAFRKGPTFAIEARSISGPASTRPVGTIDRSPNQIFRVPDFLGLGVAYSAREGGTKIALDYDWVRYSQGLKATVSESDPSGSSYKQNDAREIHLGVEHVFLVVESLFVATARGGVWYEPAHDLTFSTQSSLSFPAKDSYHWSAGLGLVVKEDFQIDAALDVSGPVKTASLSVVKFF